MTNEELNQKMQQQAQENGLGKTGEFPLGPLNEQDQGGIKIGIASTEGGVILNFGTSVDWIAMRPDHADAIAAALREQAAASRCLQQQRSQAN